MSKRHVFLAWTRMWAFGVLALLWPWMAAPALAGETVTFFHNDIAGTPLMATDEAGDVVWKESYRPYGERVLKEEASGDNRVWFTGKPQDEGTGLSYFGARYYDPVVGRFMGVDPAEIEPGNMYTFNRYWYGNGNPFRYVDPNGKDAALAVNPHGAGNNGHTTLYFQDPDGNWYKWDLGARGDAIGSSGEAGMLLGLSTPARVDLEFSNGPPSDAIVFKTSKEQDRKIVFAALRRMGEHNGGESNYELYYNNCTDGAVDVLSDAGIEVPNSPLTVRPNSWFRELQEWRDALPTVTSFKTVDE